jgi:ketosteroid isomerase-like protein
MTVIRLLAACLTTLSVSACASAPRSSPNDEQIVALVRAVMEAQQAAWNRGDIEAFMNGYERADTTTFVSSDELTRGWRVVLDRYRQRYHAREQMGTLTFSDLDIKAIGSDLVIADGRWRLTRVNDSPHGRFTLLFRRINNDWRIIHDTTTSATP